MNDMDFSNTDSQSGDIVALAYNASDKVIITNFPNVNTPIYIPQKSEESFQITAAELTTYNPVPDLLDSQQISFRNTATLAFDIANKQLKVTSSGTIAYPNFKDTKYFLFKIRDSSGTIKKSSAIKADENANTFAKELNNTSFNFGDTIELTCFAINQITISNMPATGQTTSIDKIIFNSEARQGFFKIAKQGLQEYSPAMPLPTTTLPNTIKINTITNANCLAINFNTLDKVFQTFSFSKFADNSSKYDYVIARLYDKNHTLIITSIIPSNDDSSSIRTGLITKIFDYDYILDFTYHYKARPNILITNLNGRDYTPEHFNERYKITQQGLESIPIFLPNLITISSVTDNAVAFVEFNILDNTLKGTATSNMADTSSEYDYVIVKLHALIDPTLSNPIITANLKSNTDSTAFANTINTGYYKEGFILQIICNDKALNKVTISNFGNPAQIHTVSKKIEYFKITDTGLISFTPTPMLKNNVIAIRNARNLTGRQDVLTILFDPDTLKIKATTNGEPVGWATRPWSEFTAFSYKFKDANGAVIKEDFVYAYDSYTINRDGNATNLVNKLNGTPFAYGQSFEFYGPAKYYVSINTTRIHVSNLPFNSNEYWKFNDTERVTITPLGLVLSSSPLANKQILENVIQVKDQHNGELVAQIYLDISSNKFLATSSVQKANFNSAPFEDYFVITLKDNSGKVKSFARLKETEYVDNFLNALNTVGFNLGDKIELYCKNFKKVSISNIPIFGENYMLQKNNEEFTITKLGLIPLIKLSKNKITFLGLGNDLIATISFDIDSKKLIVISTGERAHSYFEQREYFAVVLKDSSDKTIKEASVKGIENANAFETTLNGTAFQDGYTITIRFAEKGRVSISNYPNDGQTYKSPDDNPKTFTITNDSLVLKA